MKTTNHQSSRSSTYADSTQKILLVEDSAVAQNMMKQVLQFQRYKVDTARDGKKALKLFAQNGYDLVLMDLNIPFVNGAECLKRIRATEDRYKADTPVIAVTGNAEVYTEREFLKAGFSAMYQKPIDFDKLAKLIREHIRRT